MSDKIENQSDHNLTNTGILLAIFITISFIIGWWGFCWYTSHSFFGFGKRQHVAVLFKNSAGLNEDANVFMDGVKIGSVDKIEWLGVQEVLVRLSINNTKTKLSKRTKFCILTNGLIGAKYIEVTMPSAVAGEEQSEELIDENAVVLGEQPVRTELAMAKLVNLVNNFDSNQFVAQWRNDRRTFVHTADRLSVLADKAIPFAEHSVSLEDDAKLLVKELHITTTHLNRFLCDEHLPADMKELASNAIDTADSIQATVKQLNTTISDPKIREELQQILADARHCLDKMDQLTNKSGLGTDVRSTLQRTQDAMDHLNLASQQLSQILDKRHPIIHMFIGRPGYIETTIEPQK